MDHYRHKNVVSFFSVMDLFWLEITHIDDDAGK